MQFAFGDTVSNFLFIGRLGINRVLSSKAAHRACTEPSALQRTLRA